MCYCTAPGFPDANLRDAPAVFLGLHVQTQVDIPLVYRGIDLGPAFRADVIVEKCLPLELKAVSELTDLHLAQIMNFNDSRMTDGVKRVSTRSAASHGL